MAYKQYWIYVFFRRKWLCKEFNFLEIKKLYESLYELERQVNSQARKQSLVFDGNPELNRLKRDLRKHKDKNYNLYNDYTHPLYLKFWRV